MATQRTANVFITNQTDGNTQISLSHQNDSNGTQYGAWTAAPGQTVGPSESDQLPLRATSSAFHGRTVLEIVDAPA